MAGNPNFKCVTFRGGRYKQKQSPSFSPRVAGVELGVDGLDVDDGGVEAGPVVEEEVRGGDARRGRPVRHHAQQVLHQVLLHRHQRLCDLRSKSTGLANQLTKIAVTTKDIQDSVLPTSPNYQTR